MKLPAKLQLLSVVYVELAKSPINDYVYFRRTLDTKIIDCEITERYSPMILYYMRNRVRIMMRCPNCNSKDIGKIGSHQFYCWGCFIELTVNGEKMSVYQVEEDGT